MKSFIEENKKAILVGKYMAAYSSKNAVQRGVKQGLGKIEFELSMVEVQIKTVLKLI